LRPCDRLSLLTKCPTKYFQNFWTRSEFCNVTGQTDGIIRKAEEEEEEDVIISV
jgi:hypothetical protein